MSKWFDDANAPKGTYDVQRTQANKVIETNDELAEEVPVALVYNGVSHVVMLASPQDLEDFALGFSLTEGILQDKDELFEVDEQVQENGVELLLKYLVFQLKQQKKHCALQHKSFPLKLNL